MKRFFYFLFNQIIKSFFETEDEEMDLLQNGNHMKQHNDFMSNLLQENDNNLARENQRQQEQFMHQNDLTQQMNDMNNMNDFPF